MQPTELLRYPTLEPISKVAPVLKEIAQSQPPIPNPQTSLENAISSIFAPQEEENKIARTKKHLGEKAKLLTDEQIECITTEFQFLIDTWLDEYERDVFEGKTLQEILNGE